MNNLLVMPILIPMLFGVLSLLAYRSIRVQKILGVIGTIFLLTVSIALFMSTLKNGYLVLEIGSWQAPYGITLVSDIFSATMQLLTGIVGLAVGWYSLSMINEGRHKFGYFSLFHFLMMGVNGAFLTGDLFNLYVWFEVMLISSFVLMALGGERAQMAGAIKYVTINLFSSALFLAALGILYGIAGTVNMADLAVKFSQVESGASRALISTLSILFLAVFGIKAAIFPLFFWLPASYHTPPAAVAAIFSGLLTKVGVYALIRVFTLIFLQDTTFTHTIILILASLTMLIGVLGAMSQNDFRRILSFHIVSQIGYMLMGLGLFTPLALAGSVFYIFHHILVKTNLFLVSGIVEQLGKTAVLKKLGGLYRSQPVLSILFLVPAMSLAGIPPLSGFFAKFNLIKAGLIESQYLVVAVSLLVSLFTLFSMIKIWNEAFWKTTPEENNTSQVKLCKSMILPVGFLALLTLSVGFAIEPVFDVAMQAGVQLVEPASYINAVLGGVR